MLSINDINLLQSQNEGLKKQNEELQKQIRNLQIINTKLQNRNQQLNDATTKAKCYEQALNEIEKELKEDVYCESQECGCDDFEECLKCTKEHILDIINKAKDGNNAN